MKDFNVIENDLNLIDTLNGDASVNFKEFAPIGLKGALSKNIDLSGSTGFGSSVLNNRLLWLNQKRNEIVENITENWDYNNLPDNLSKYDIEGKLLDNGSVAFIKILNEIQVVNYVDKKIDIYNNPKEIQIIEPDFKLDQKVFNEFGILRSNLSKSGVFVKSMRILNMMEKMLYEIEKNITASAPKGLIINNGLRITTPDNQERSESLNSIVNGSDTFYEINLNDSEGANIFGDTKTIWVPIELKDRTNELITNYSFWNEQLKQLFGQGTNMLNGKRERLIQGEIETQQATSDLNLQHMINIRKNDIKNINKVFNLNIEFIDITQERDEENGETNEFSDTEQTTTI